MLISRETKDIGTFRRQIKKLGHSEYKSCIIKRAERRINLEAGAGVTPRGAGEAAK